MTTEESRKAFDMMANATGVINESFSNSKAVTAMNDLVTYAGYSTEEAEKLYSLSQLNNQSVDDTVSSLQGQLKVLQVNNKLRINEKQAVEMVAKASATVRMNLGANPKKLADAAFYATKLGMTLDEISSAAEQTLNFESAIQNQLEYQVLTGKEINIDAYQQAAASGDAAAASKELNKLIEEQGPNIEKNTFAQEALSKTLGISREQLMKSIQLQKLQKKLGGEQVDIEKAINLKMKEGLSYEEAAAEVGKDGYKSILEQNKNAQVFSRTVAEIKESFMTALSGSEGFKKLFSKENIAGYVKTIQEDIIPAVIKLAKLAGEFIEFLTKDETKTFVKDLVSKLGTVAKVLGAIIAINFAGKLAGGILNISKAVGGLITGLGKAGSLLAGLGKSKIPSATPSAAPSPSPVGGGGGMSGNQANNFTKGINANAMLKGAAAILVLSSALYVAAKAFQEFGQVKWEDVAKGTVALGGLTIAAYGISKIKGKILEGALAIGILGASLYPAAKAFQEFGKVNWGDMAKAGVALTGLGIAAAVLAPLVESGMLLIGAAGIAALGLSLIPLAAALNLAEPGLIALGDVFSKVLVGIPPIINSIADGLVRLATEADPINLIALGASLSALAIGIGALGIAAATAGIADAASSFLGGGGLFTLLERLIELSKVDFKPAAKSLKEGIIEIASIGAGIDLGPFEDIFEDLSDAIEEIDIDDLVAFASLANANLAGAAQNLITGFNSLVGINTKINLSPLEDTFDLLEDAISELNIDDLVAFASLANADLAGAGKKIIEGFNSLVGINTKINLSPLEDTFDLLEDVIDELNIDDLVAFASLANADLGTAGQKIIEGFNKLSSVDLKGINLGSLEDLFDELEDVLAELDFDQLNQFSQLVNINFTQLTTSLKEGITGLIKIGDISSELSKVEDTFDLLEDAISELDFDQLNQLSAINTSNLDTVSTSITNIGTSMSSFQNSLDSEKINSISNSMESLGEKLVSFYENDFSGTEVAAQLQELANIDSSKIVTLAEAIAKLSESFSGLNGTLSSMGDIAPVVTVTEEFVKLHKTVTATPLEQAVESVKTGVKNTYEQAKSWVTSLVFDDAIAQKLNTTQMSDGVVQMRDGVVQVQDASSNLNPNGGLVISKFQKGQLQPVAQGIKEDKAYLTPNSISPPETNVNKNQSTVNNTVSNNAVNNTSSANTAATNIDTKELVSALKAIENVLTNINSKEGVVQLNGQTVGKVLSPIIVREINNTSVSV
jgi:hypothetical protein